MNELNFHHLVEQSLMEQHLIRVFPEQDFIDLNLPLSTFPLIQQGLPRDLDPFSTSFLQLKTGFRDLNTLKKRILDKPTLYQYKHYPILKDLSIVIITYVVPGGFGDYFAQSYLKKILKKRFQEVDITSVIFIEKSYSQKITCEEDEILCAFNAVEELKPQYFDLSLKRLFKKAHIVFEIPTPFPFKKELQLLSSQASYIQIGEYGFIQSSLYEPKSAARCLGLHFLEYGLFIDNPSKTSLENFSKLDVSAYLFSIKDPHLYLKSNDMYFSYLATDYGVIFYLYLIIYLSLHQDKIIDLVCIDIGPFLKVIESDIERLKNLPIKTIEIFYKNNRSVLNLDSKGLHLRIIHTGHLNHKDFQILLQASKEPVGIRGNLSLSEAIALQKGFFYDPLSHNYPVYYELLSLAKLHDQEVFLWMQLFKPALEPHVAAQKGAALIRQKDFQKAFKNILSFINTHLKADEHMINIVYKELINSQNPGLQNKERELTSLFLEEKISFLDFIKTLQKEMIEASWQS
jgi:hypothetical protein